MTLRNRKAAVAAAAVAVAAVAVVAAAATRLCGAARPGGGFA